MSNEKIDKLIKAHFALKAKIEEMDEAHKKQKMALVAKQEMIQAALKNYLNNNKLKSVRSDSGTAYKKTNQFVGVDDWDSFLRFITESWLRAVGFENSKELEAMVKKVVSVTDWQFFKRSVNKSAVLEFREDKGESPPGIKYTEESVIGIRKQ